MVNEDEYNKSLYLRNGARYGLGYY